MLILPALLGGGLLHMAIAVVVHPVPTLIDAADTAHIIHITDMRFSPDRITVPAGMMNIPMTSGSRDAPRGL